MLTGASLQNNWNETHRRTLQWVKASAAAGEPWVVANDEQGPADLGVPPDPGYQGHSGEAKSDRGTYTLHDIRKQTLWGNLMAGGAGVEYYFGYKLPENDLGCEDWRSRDKSWDYGRIALEFFHNNKIPFWEMKNANERAGGQNFCLALKDELFVIYLPNGGAAQLSVPANSNYSIERFNPRTGGAVVKVPNLTVPENESTEDWVFLVRKTK